MYLRGDLPESDFVIITFKLCWVSSDWPLTGWRDDDSDVTVSSLFELIRMFWFRIFLSLSALQKVVHAFILLDSASCRSQTESALRLPVHDGMATREHGRKVFFQQKQFTS